MPIGDACASSSAPSVGKRFPGGYRYRRRPTRLSGNDRWLPRTDRASRGRVRTTWRRSAVTLADVARRAGVSTATASRIINDSPKPVAEELRERVLRRGRRAAVRAERARPAAGPRRPQRGRGDRARRLRPVLRRDHPGPAAGRHRPRPAGHHLQQLPRPGPRAGVRRAAARPAGRGDRAGRLRLPRRAVHRGAGRASCASTSGPAAGSPSSAGTSTPATRSCRPTSTAATWPATRSTGSATPRSG